MDKERLFQEHVDGLAEKKRMQFRKLLEETPQVCLSSRSRLPNVC